MQPREWCLFIDESGDFIRERSLAAGLLLEEADTPSLDAALRGMLEQAMPVGGWPLHAAHLNVPSFTPAANAARCRNPQHPLAPELAECGRELAALDPALWDAAVADAAAPHRLEPHVALSRRASHEAPALASRLNALRDALRSQLAGAVAAFAASYRRQAFVVGGSVAPDDEGEKPGDSYLRALTVLFERVLGVLRGQGPGIVWAIAATRDVRAVASLPRIPLRPADVGASARAALDFPLGDQGDTREDVRIVPGMPRRYDGGVHGGLVLADLISNGLRAPVMGARDWRHLTAACKPTFAFSLEQAAGLLRGAGPLPCVAADGAARTALAEVLRGALKPQPLPAAPGWARDQAARWMGAVRLHGGAR
jgi:hypothetical protein